MKVYSGIREKSGNIVTVTSDGVSSALNPRLDLRNHSPTGLEWGYGGSGPAQLALAILADHLSDPALAQNLYQDFKFNVVARLTSDQWLLSSNDVENALQEIRAKNIEVEST